MKLGSTTKWTLLGFHSTSKANIQLWAVLQFKFVGVLVVKKVDPVMTISYS